MVDQLVKLERVDLAAIQPLEPFPHMVKKPSQLLIVISADQLPRGPAPSLLTFNVTNPDRIAHGSNLPPIDLLAKCCLDLLLTPIHVCFGVREELLGEPQPTADGFRSARRLCLPPLRRRGPAWAWAG